MATVVKGKDFALYVEKLLADGLTKKYIMIGCATSSTLSMQTEFQDASCKGSGGWREGTVTTKSWSVSTDALLRVDGGVDTDVDSQDIWKYWNEGTLLKIQMGEGGSGGTVYKGDVFITSLEFNGPDGENATLSVTMEGTGPLTTAEIA